MSAPEKKMRRPGKIYLSKKLMPQHINLDLQSDNRDDIIRELSLCLKDDGNITDYDTFLKEVYKRESKASTGIGKGVAIPHARTKNARELVVAIGRKSSGVDFNSLDGKPAEIIILMGAPLSKINDYLKQLAHLNYLLKRPGFTNGLREAPDARAVIDLFKKHESLE